MAEWELSKENIQPLRQGRKASALIEQPDSHKISEQKQAYELALRTYDGDDPLEAWYTYIVWVEQTYPNGGKEGNLNSLLEKCLKEFKDEVKYNDDPRFFEVWMKYANLSSNPLEVYNFMHTEKICQKVPKFYVEWAWELEQVNNFKKAETTFKLAYETIGDQEDNLDSLKAKHKQFQARVMKKMLEKSDDNISTPVEEQRSVLSSLKGHGKQQKVGSLRIGAAKVSDGPGTLSTAQALSKSKSNSKFTVFQENDENSTTAPRTSGTSGNFPGGKERNRENEMDPGKWTKNRVGKKAHAVAFDQIGSVGAKPAFQVHQDEDIVEKVQTAGKTVKNVLTAHKPKADEDDVPIALALFEPPDPTKKPMYCKHLVYQGVTEFSFEELRAARFRQKEAKIEIENQKIEMERVHQEMLEERRSMIREQELLKEQFQQAFEQQKLEFQKQQMEFQQQLQKQNEELQALKKSGSGPSEFTVPQKPMRSRPAPLEKFKVYSEENSLEPNSASLLLDDTKALLQKDALGGSGFSGSGSLQHKTPPRVEFNRMLSEPSPTINTKEAKMLAEKMWSEQKPTRPKPVEKFEIFQDSQEVEAKPEKISLKPRGKPKPTIIINDKENDENAIPKFEVFQDPSPALQIEPEKPKFEVFSDPSPKINQYDEENPKTMFIPSLEDFNKMATAASTPFHGRGFIPDEDENTCAVDLVFKKPTLPSSASNDKLDRNTPPEQIIPLSPIMETSRENYKSSSSSSNASMQSHLHTKSHWGNTQTPGAFLGHNKTPGQIPVFPGQNKSFKPSEITSISGYMADSSNAHHNSRTPGVFLAGQKKPFLDSPSSAKQENIKKLKIQEVDEEEEDEDYEPTAMLGMVSEFQKETAKPLENSILVQERRPENSFMSQSLQFGGDQTENFSMMGAANQTGKLGTSKMDNTTNRLLSVTRPELDISKPNLDFTKPNLDLTKPQLDISKPSLDVSRPTLDVTKPSLDLTSNVNQEDVHQLQENLGNISLREELDPFDSGLHERLLKMVVKPVETRHGFVDLRGYKTPQVKSNSNVKIGDSEFFCMECKGEGGYGKVFKAMRCNNMTNTDCTIADMDAVLKVQKPARPWEFYVCTEIHERLRDAKDENGSSWFMNIPRCYLFDDGSIFVSEHQLLSLLDVCNLVPQMKKTSIEPIAMFFTIEMLQVLERLQKARIIHGDIKPDNFLVQRKPDFAQDMFKKAATLQMIDFGVSIDMDLFHAEQTFTFKFEKSENRCPEMLEDRAWTYQLDYFGVAGVAHTLLHGNYMKLVKKGVDSYVPNGSLKRWWDCNLWTDFFHQFLNINEAKLPDVKSMREKFEASFINLQQRSGFDTAATELNKLLLKNA